MSRSCVALITRLLPALFLLVVIISDVAAQTDSRPGRIVGRILDASTGAGLPDVGVQLVGTTLGAVEQMAKSTDSDAAQAAQRVSGVMGQGRYKFFSYANRLRWTRGSPLHVRDNGVGAPLPECHRLTECNEASAGVAMHPTCARLILLSCTLFHVAIARANAQGTSAGSAANGAQLSFSGVLFGSFQYRLDEGARATNRFELDRAYLNFRMPVGDRTSIRVTTDVYQQQRSGDDAYYAGWTIRAKYAYVQHDFLKGNEWSAYGRLGMLNTVLIEHVENFWPRFLSPVAVDRAGYFSSADLGVSTQVSLPRRFGEVVAAITNGPGYTSRERDRFKDYSARVSLTPMSTSTSALTRSATLSLWGYKGALGSRFAAPAAGQLGPVNDALRRDRYGVFAGVKDPRVTLGVEYARRFDEGEAGSNTTVSPRVVIDSTGTVMSAFAVARPFQLLDASATTPLGLIARRDWVTMNNAANRGQTTTIVGALWDLSRRATLALDYQVQLPDENTGLPLVKTIFVHYVASF